MKPVWVVGGALLAGCLISPVIPIGSGKSSNEVQRENITKLFPAQLSARGTWKGEVRVARLRVWADDEYRAQNVRWQHGFDEELDYANQVMTPMLGVRLEAEYRQWDRHAPTDSLESHLAALTELDDGDDVVWVVGLTSSQSLVSGSFDLIGLAAVVDRHVVVRGYADLEERKVFERAFRDIGEQERAQVLEARRRHKTTCVLIHELAHSLGALHEVERDWVMNASYSHRAAQISDRNRELMLITLEDRLKPRSARDPRGTAQRLLATLDSGWAGWDPNDREMLTGQLRQMGPQAATGIAGVPAPVAEQYRHAEQLLARGDHRGAQAVIEPMVAAYPAHAELRLLGCRVELARGGAKDGKAIAACERAIALGDARTAIKVAAARMEAGDAAGARAALTAVEAQLAKLPARDAGAGWLALAAQYRAMNAVTWAEAAFARSGAGPDADPDTATWIAETRIRYGIPRDGAAWKLVPDDDAAAVVAVHAILAKSNEGNYGAAGKLAAAAEKRWPGLPGVLTARCDVAYRSGAFPTARAYCTRAIAKGPSSWALYLLGVIELQSEGRAATKAGIERLRAAIEIDPELRQGWRTLGKAYERAGMTEERHQLRVAYQTRFGTAM
jgi:tetratricopeptide (TPR) repeat protein